MIYHHPPQNLPPQHSQPIRFNNNPNPPQIVFNHPQNVPPRHQVIQNQSNIQVIQQYSQPIPHQQQQNSLIQRPHQKSVSQSTHQPTHVHVSLVQPPQLEIQQQIDNSSRHGYHHTNMSISNNQQSQFENYNRQQEKQWTNEAQMFSMYWEQNCMKMVQRFEWLYDRFLLIKTEYQALTEQMQKMDSEDEWHMFQQHHDEFHQKIQEMWQEIQTVLSQNSQLMIKNQEQDTENVWEQRYQELLGNFKSLQQEMMETDTIRQQNQQIGQQYKMLYERYQELQSYYHEAVNENQALKQNGPKKVSDSELEQIDIYKQQLDKLHQENLELQHYVVEYQDKYNSLKHQTQNMLEKEKLDQLLHELSIKDQEINHLKYTLNSKTSDQGNVAKLENTIQQKNRQIQVFRKRVSEKQDQISSVKQQMYSTQEKIKIKLKDQFDSEKRRLQSKIRDLENIMKDLKSETLKTSQSSYKLDILQKKIQHLNQQNTNLNDTLKKKNQELIEYRGVSYELEKLRQIQSEYYRTIQDKQRLNEALNKRNSQIQMMYRELDELTMKINEISSKKPQHNIKNLQLQIQDLQSQIRYFQAQLNKSKSIQATKNQYIFRLEDDLRITKQRLINYEQTLFMEREEWKSKELKLSSRNLEHEKRVKNLDHQFNIQMKQTLEKEIIALRKDNTQKQEKIRSIQEKQLLISSKLAVFEKQKQNYDRDILLIKSKERQTESHNDNYIKKFRQLEVAYNHKEQELSILRQNNIATNGQIILLKGQIKEKENIISSKDKSLRQLQSQLAKLFGQIENMGSLKAQNTKLRVFSNNLQQECDRIKRQFDSRLGQSKTLSSNQSRTEIYQQEKELVQQLLQENQNFKQQFAKLLNDKSFIVPKQSQKVAVDLSKRLNEFSLKLQTVISGNDQLRSKMSSSGVSNRQGIDPQYQAIVQRYEKEIHELKHQLKSKFTSISQISQGGYMKQSGRFAAQIRQEQDDLRQEAAFYKEKIKQQEERSQTLIKINEQLKDKIQNVLKFKENPSTLEYFKDLNKHLENENQALKQKLKRLNQQNRQIKLDLNYKNSKINQQYEIKILDLQLQIQELQRKLAYLSVDKISSKIYTSNVAQQKPNPHKYSQYNISDVNESSSKKKSKKVTIEIPQAKGMKEQFQSVLGNLNDSPKKYTSPVYSNSYINQSQVSHKSDIESPKVYVNSRFQKV